MRFAGYAAVFGVADRGGDVVRAGAFQATVDGLRMTAVLPLLWQHRGDARDRADRISGRGCARAARDRAAGGNGGGGRGGADAAGRGGSMGCRSDTG